MSATRLPASLEKNPRLARWLRFRRDGTVEVRSGKVEIGQGILTALRQVAADELDVALERVHLVPADTACSPDEGVTSGSLSMQDSGAALRWACAEARAIYLAAAAARLGADIGTLTVREGEIRAPGPASTSYAELADDALLERDATGAAAPKGVAFRRLTGESAPRIDLPDKVLGRHAFIHDIRRPGMLHGRVLRPPSPAATLLVLEEGDARGMPGVVDVVRDGSFVGVIAEREEIAAEALERLAKHARWRETPSLPDESTLAEWLRTQPHETTLIAEHAAAGEGSIARTLSARFTRPFLAHASIGPSCAVAQWKGAQVRVWSHTQGIFNLRADLALALSIDADQVRVAHAQGAGCYGHNGADDAALDAALLARAVPGRPVRVQWSREDELAWSPFGPAMAISLEADLDGEGEVLAWRGDVWSNGHGTRPGRARTPALLAAWHLAKPFERPMAVNPPLSSGGGSERNAVPGYEFPALRVSNHRVLAMPLRPSALRSLGAFANVFAVESFADDLARARGEDPLAWRLRHLADPRARAVIEAAGRLARWSEWSAREGCGQGIGFARYKGTGAFCAVVAQVELTHEVRVTRLAIAVDVGFAVNPDGVANQVEGGAIQAASWTLKEAVRFDRTRITSGAWESYPILRFSEVPAVQVEVLQHAAEASLGAGEAAQGPTAAAIGNAVFNAIGARIRDLPITAERIAAAET